MPDERLDVGNPYMMGELAEVLAFNFEAERTGSDFPFRLISRRSSNFINSVGRSLPGTKLTRGKGYNPLFVHPQDLTELGLKPGDEVTIASRHDRIPGVVEADETMRRKVVAMYHCFGGLVDEDSEFRSQGSNVGRLTPIDTEFDPITGIPRMSNIAVSISADGDGWAS